MKKLRNFFALLCLLASLFVAPSAQAAGGGMMRFSVLGGMNDMLNTSGGIGYTAGAAIDFWLGPMAELSLGGQYLSRAFTGISNLAWVQIPAIIRFKMHFIQIGGGGFYDVPVSASTTSNYGVTGSLRLKPMMFPLFVEGRYNYGLNTSSGLGINSSEVQALLGIMF